jgi:outer membrane immunogenic protein
VTRVLTTGLTKTGWTAGAGAEYRLNRNWSVGAEYLYVDLGADSLAAGPSTAPVGNVPAGAWPATRATFKDVSNILRATLNYRFN